ncbi:MAG: glycosyltransferase family 1 protein [Chitinophagales bacterium]
MKIGFDAKRAFFNNTGLGNYSRTLIKSLVKYYPDNQYILYSPKSIQNSPFAEIQNFKNIEVKIPQTRFQKLFDGSVWRSLQLGNQIKSDQLDIYHGLSHELPRNIHRSRPQTKNIVTIHDLIFLRYPDLYSKIDRLIYRQKWKYACQQADKVIAISEQTKSDIIEFLGIEASKIEVVYQGCHPSFYDYNDAIFLQHGLFKQDNIEVPYDLPEEYILYVGSITERKNLLTIAKALHIMKGSLNPHLVVVGDGGAYKQQVVNYLQQHGLQKSVTFLSNIPNEHLPNIYRKALVMVYPSLFEGFGIPIIEALFSRTPVITSDNDCSCFREAAGEGALYVNPLDAEELAHAIEEAMTNGAVRIQLMANGWNHVDQFREEEVVGRMMEVYQGIT